MFNFVLSVIVQSYMCESVKPQLKTTAFKILFPFIMGILFTVSWFVLKRYTVFISRITIQLSKLVQPHEYHYIRSGGT